MIYVRWKKDESRRGRVFEPVGDERPDIAAMECVICFENIGTKRGYQLLVVGPTDDEDRKKHDEGRWYSAGATLTHEDCLRGMGDAGLNFLANELRVVSPDPQ
jgi:hypothetical protein